MNDISLYFHDLCPNFTRQHAVFFLKTLGKIRRSRETYIIGNLRDTHAAAFKQSLCLSQTGLAEQIYHRRSRHRLHLAIKLNAAQANLLTNILYTKLAVGEILLDDATLLFPAQPPWNPGKDASEACAVSGDSRYEPGAPCYGMAW